MAGLREQKKKATRAAIMQAAIKLFGGQGYEHISIAALAKEAGIGKGTIYSYFKSKNEILLSFCEEELAFIHEEIRLKLDPEAPFTEKMVFLFMSEFRYVTKNPEFGRTLMRELIFPREITVEKSRELDSRFISLFTKIIGEARDTGQLHPDTDLFFACGQYYALYLLVVSLWYSGRLQSEEDVRSTMEIMFEQALNGLHPEARQSSRKKLAAELVRKAILNHEPGSEGQSVL